MGSTFRLANQKLNILWSFSAAGGEGGGGLFKSEAPHTHTGALKYCSFSCGNPTSCTLLLFISPGVKSDDRTKYLIYKARAHFTVFAHWVLVAQTNNHWGPDLLALFKFWRIRLPRSKQAVLRVAYLIPDNFAWGKLPISSHKEVLAKQEKSYGSFLQIISKTGLRIYLLLLGVGGGGGGQFQCKRR